MSKEELKSKKQSKDFAFNIPLRFLPMFVDALGQMRKAYGTCHHAKNWKIEDLDGLLLKSGDKNTIDLRHGNNDIGEVMGARRYQIEFYEIFCETVKFTKGKGEASFDAIVIQKTVTLKDEDEEDGKKKKKNKKKKKEKEKKEKETKTFNVTLPVRNIPELHIALEFLMANVSTTIEDTANSE